MALIHAFLVITFRASQIVSGLALTIFAGAVGLSSYLGNDLNLADAPAAPHLPCRVPGEHAALAGDRADRVRPGRPGLHLVALRDRDLALPVAHEARPQRPLGRRVAGRSRHDGDQRHCVPLRAYARRRRVRGRRGRDDHARDHAAMGERDHRRRRLDRDRARHLRVLAARALPRRRLLLRCAPGARARSCRPATSASARPCCGRTPCRT